MKQHSTKVFRDIVNALGSFIQSLFIVPNAGNSAAVSTAAGQSLFLLLFPWTLQKHILILLLVKSTYLRCAQGLTYLICCSHYSLIFCAGGSGSGTQGVAQGGPGAGGVSGNLSTQAAFEFRGTWIPLMTVSVQGSAKAT